MIFLSRLMLKAISVRDLCKMPTPGSRFCFTVTLNAFISSLSFMRTFCLAIIFGRFADSASPKPLFERFFNSNFFRNIFNHPAVLQVVLFT